MDAAVDHALQRLSRRHSSGVWVGAIRRAFGPVAEVSSTAQDEPIDNHPPHYLLALWKPLKPNRPFLRRWPSFVSLVAPNAQRALDEMLRQIPDGQRLWLTREALDWALMAEIVTLCEPGLQAWQLRELKTFIDSERVAVRAEIGRGYGRHGRPAEMLTMTLPGPGPKSA